MQSDVYLSIGFNCCDPGFSIAGFPAHGKTALDFARAKINVNNVDPLWAEIVSFLELSMGDKAPPPDGKMLRKYAHENDLEGIRRELDKGVDINENPGMGEAPALLDCIESEAKIETIKFLIENGADVNFKNQFGVNFLTYFLIIVNN